MKYFSPAELAKVLRCSSDTIFRLIAEGRLEANITHKDDSVIYQIPAFAVKEYLGTSEIDALKPTIVEINKKPRTTRSNPSRDRRERVEKRTRQNKGKNEEKKNEEKKNVREETRRPRVKNRKENNEEEPVRTRRETSKKIEKKEYRRENKRSQKEPVELVEPSPKQKKRGKADKSTVIVKERRKVGTRESRSRVEPDRIREPRSKVEPDRKVKKQVEKREAVVKSSGRKKQQSEEAVERVAIANPKQIDSVSSREKKQTQAITRDMVMPELLKAVEEMTKVQAEVLRNLQDIGTILGKLLLEDSSPEPKIAPRKPQRSVKRNLRRKLSEK